MKFYVDKDGKVAWIYDEKKVEQKDEVRVNPFDLNKDGKIDGKDLSLLSRKLKEVKKK